LAFNGLAAPDDTKLFVMDPRVDWKDQTPTVISRVVAPGLTFMPRSWSPDGQQLAGTATAERFQGPLVIYSFATRRFIRLYDSPDADSPLWLNDGHRLIFHDKSRLMLIDSQTQVTRELMSIAPDTMDLSWVTRDNRAVYFVRRVEQADIWLMRSK
jgi:hypothetical protein